MRPGEWTAFLADVADHGIATPLDITPAGVVLDGRHRLRAATELGLGRVPVRVVAPPDETGYILRAALQRRHLNPSQIAAIVVGLDDYHHTLQKSRDRQRANLRHTTEAATLPPPTDETLDALARRYGISPRTLRDAHTIKRLAPDQLAHIAAGDIPAHRLANRLRRIHRDAQLSTPRLPRGRYEVILADPPWQLGNPDSSLAPDQHYPTLPLTDITNLAVPAAQDAILFLWAVNSLLPEALDVCSAWGFTAKTNMAWVKQSIGPGVWLRNRHELLLVAVRGAWSPPDPHLRVDSVITAKRRRHSQKPDQAYERIEAMYPHARRLELFARTRRAGWTSWGNQLPQPEEAIA
jgi:N6-adenosine-specific RNA methylase IME4